jgi:hypothetical protein
MLFWENVILGKCYFGKMIKWENYIMGKLYNGKMILLGKSYLA